MDSGRKRADEAIGRVNDHGGGIIEKKKKFRSPPRKSYMIDEGRGEVLMGGGGGWIRGGSSRWPLAETSRRRETKGEKSLEGAGDRRV